MKTTTKIFAKITHTSSIFMLLCVFALVSCTHLQEPTVDNLKNVEAGYLIEDDFLSFDSEESYVNIRSYLFENQDKLRDWEKSLDDFTSMRTVFHDITYEEQEQISLTSSLAGYENYIYLLREEDGLDAVRVVSNPITATLVNKDGLIKIGAKIIKYTYGHIIEVENPTPEQIATLRTSYEGNLPPFGEISEIVRTELSSSTINRSSSDNCKTDHYISSPKRRIRGVLKHESGLTYQYVLGSTRHQRKVAGIWWADDVAKVTLDVDGTVTWGSSPPTPVDYSGEEINENIIELSVVECLNPCVYTSADLDGTHSCDCDGGFHPSCTTYID